MFNFLFILIWHVIVFIICVSINSQFYLQKEKKNSEFKYKSKKRFYENVLKIKKWKVKLPQYVGVNGYSKERFIDKDILDLYDFLNETYRGEWNHAMSCTIIPVLFLINTIEKSIILSIIIIIINLPFILIQRYNRLRIWNILLKKNKTRNNLYLNYTDK
ncbi:MAG: glycosyl-4,4'-diaponeurosporenoate acyltransferase [Candidatus Improbicoccus devescovinae]|nr:MAG: glycosyl-4,4'-diaponeurosporenoate acyltransferase [Candidatus Improbicoccus devescovinae]